MKMEWNPMENRNSPDWMIQPSVNIDYFYIQSWALNEVLLYMWLVPHLHQIAKN